jgi:hypothetical protein
MTSSGWCLATDASKTPLSTIHWTPIVRSLGTDQKQWQMVKSIHVFDMHSSFLVVFLCLACLPCLRVACAGLIFGFFVFILARARLQVYVPEVRCGFGCHSGSA